MPGVTTTLVSVWLTVTSTALVVLSPAASAIVTVKRYVPEFANVTVVFFAALTPLAEKVGATAPTGSEVVDHV